MRTSGSSDKSETIHILRDYYVYAGKYVNIAAGYYMNSNDYVRIAVVFDADYFFIRDCNYNSTTNDSFYKAKWYYR